MPLLELIIQVDGGHIPFKTQKNAVLKPCQPLCIDLKIFMQGTNTIAKLLIRLVLFPQGMTIYKPSRFI